MIYLPIFILFGLYMFLFLFLFYKEFNSRHKFYDNITTGSKLTRHVKLIHDEFASSQTFTITVLKKGKEQVRVMFDDGHTEVMDLLTLYKNNWKLI